MAEATEEVKEQPDLGTDLPQDAPPPEPTPPVEDDEGKPGGSDPQAVRARKEYQARKRAEDALAVAREETIRLQERAKVLEEQLKKPKAEPAKVYSMAEVNQLVRDEKITQADADRYIEDVILPAKVETVLQKRETVRAERTPVESAGKYIDEYISLHPTLKDTASDDFRKVATEYNRLVQEDGLPSDFRTQKVALNSVLGTLEQRREKTRLANIAATARTIPVDGGGGSPPKGGKIDIAKAPATMQADWDREGVDQATKERRYGIYLDLKAARANR